MFPPRPIRPYHFQTDLIWGDSPFKRITIFKLHSPLFCLVIFLLGCFYIVSTFFTQLFFANLNKSFEYHVEAAVQYICISIFLRKLSEFLLKWFIRVFANILHGFTWILQVYMLALQHRWE